jgi:hypothetical protein
MVEFSKKPDYRGDLTLEIQRLTEEANSIKKDLVDIK